MAEVTILILGCGPSGPVRRAVVDADTLDEAIAREVGGTAATVALRDGRVLWFNAEPSTIKAQMHGQTIPWQLAANIHAMNIIARTLNIKPSTVETLYGTVVVTQHDKHGHPTSRPTRPEVEEA